MKKQILTRTRKVNFVILSTILIIFKTNVICQIPINIDMSSSEVIPGDLQGMCSSGMFTISTYNWTDDTNPLTNNFSYQQILNANPQVLRFPTGGESGYCKLLGSDPYALFSTVEPYSTYGFGFEMDAAMDDYLHDHYDGDYADAYDDWMDKIDEQNDSRMHEPYIIQFKRFVKQLETDLGHTIDIIYTMNIHTADAAYNEQVLRYLLNWTDITADGVVDYYSGLNVIGVEMGNEEYNSYAGHSDYSNFLDYIDALEEEGNNYIEMVRCDLSAYNLQIGITAAPVGELKRLVLTGGECSSSTYIEDNPDVRQMNNDWNVAIKKCHKGTVDGYPNYLDGPCEKPKWDAVIAHPYADEKYLSNSLYSACNGFTHNAAYPYDATSLPALDNIFETGRLEMEYFFHPEETCDDYPEDCDCFDANSSDDDDAINGYTYQINDWVEGTALADLDYDYVGLPGIVQYFINVIHETPVKLWFTEWNLNPKDTDDDYCPVGSAHYQCNDNTVFHGMFIHEWMMEMLQMNKSEHWNGLIQYATLHNLMGTNTQTNMLTWKKNLDNNIFQGVDYYDDVDDPDNLTKMSRRMCFYPFQFSSFVKGKNLESVDISVPPGTFGKDLRIYGFLDKNFVMGVTGSWKLYLYYFNTSPTSDKTIGPITIDCSDPTACNCLPLTLSNYSTKYIQGSKLYSTAGSSNLYKYNSYYWNAGCYVQTQPNFEISQASVTNYPGPNFTLKKRSFGVAIITINWGFCAKEDLEKPIAGITAYPNPFTDQINFEIDYAFLDGMNYKLLITDIYGKEIDIIPVSESNSISYSSQIAAGVYLYQLIENSIVIASGNFVKQ